MSELVIRDAALTDAPALWSIYKPYVEKTVITFETEVPTVEEFGRRIQKVQERYPYLVALLEGRPVGYAYGHPFVGRAAYDWAAELSIYVAENLRQAGVGGQLYAALTDALKKMGVLNLYACIGVPDQEDEYLNFNSAQFHAHLGFKEIGTFHACGYKFNRWYNMIWMGKTIGEHLAKQPPIIPYPQLRKG